MSDADATPGRKVRPFYWSVRREVWENRALYIAPLAAVAVVLLAFLVASFRLPGAVAGAAAGGRAAEAFNMPYAAAAAAAFMISFFVAIFYCLGALQGERRDRSVLFWKSLPVSDTTTVLAKAAVPLVVLPLIVIAVSIGAQLVMLVWSTLVLLLNGVDPSQLWSRLHLPMFWVMIPYGLLVHAFWDVPFYGWLLLVSAWARRMPIVWAVAPWLGLALFEFLAFRTRHVLQLLELRVFGGFSLAYSADGKGKVPIETLSQVDPMRILAHPGLWSGLLFGAACLAGCVWLRRRNPPL